MSGSTPRTALVLGGTSDIGLALLEHLCAEGLERAEKPARRRRGDVDTAGDITQGEFGVIRIERADHPDSPR